MDISGFGGFLVLFIALPSFSKDLSFTQVELPLHRTGTLPQQYPADPKRAGISIFYSKALPWAACNRNYTLFWCQLWNPCCQGKKFRDGQKGPFPVAPERGSPPKHKSTSHAVLWHGITGRQAWGELLFPWSKETSHLMSKIINNRASLLKWY